MAEPQSREGPSTSDFSGGNSDSALQLNIKTLDSRIYSFHVDKNIVISAFKEKIASQSGVPVGLQRLIFRGKVLKDDHLLSEYNVENGDTLHLVERQPQPSSGSNPREANSRNSNTGQDSNAGGPRNRVGSIAHSIVLGTVNVGDPGEAVVPDLSRVIGAVLNTIGISNQAGGIQTGVPTFHGSGTEGSPPNAGIQTQGGNQSVPLQAFHGQSAPQAMQIPLGGSIAVPSMNMPIPDSLNTLVEFMNRMEVALSQNGNQPNQSTSATAGQPSTELPTDSRGLPTVEALSIILRHAQRLLSDHAVPALSHTAGRLNQEGGSNDPAVRGQVQTESIRLGMAMQHLGALFLELGRTILALRMGQSPTESLVNAGPAVYISPSGPNPIMVQPFPLQTSSLFGGSSTVSTNPVAVGVGPVGLASIPRNVSIHIHTVASRALNGEGVQGESGNVTEPGDSAQAWGPLGINITANPVAVQPATVSISGASPPSSGVTQAASSNNNHLLVAEVNSQIRNRVAAMLNQNQTPPPGQSPGSSLAPIVSAVGSRASDGGVHGERVNATESGDSSLLGLLGTARDQSRVECGARGEDMSSCGMNGQRTDTSPAVTGVDNQKGQTAFQERDIKKTGDVVISNSEPSVSSDRVSEIRSNMPNPGNDNPDCSSGVPLGLGLGGLQPKRRGRQPRTQTKDGNGASGSSLNQQSTAIGQQVLQSLASLSTRAESNPLPSEPSAAGGSDVTDAMSQLLQSPALDGLLSGVSQQTSVGSPDMLRNILQQFTQNPAMRNTVNQIAQQIDSHDLGSMFSGLDRGAGGGIDLSRMMQQMMPIVSQALGGVSSVPSATRPSEPVLSGSRSRREMTEINDQHIDLHQVVQRLENGSSSDEIFRSLVDSAVNLSGDRSAGESVVDEMCGQGEFVQEFIEMLSRDISRRFEDSR